MSNELPNNAKELPDNTNELLFIQLDKQQRQSEQSASEKERQDNKGLLTMCNSLLDTFSHPALTSNKGFFNQETMKCEFPVITAILVIKNALLNGEETVNHEALNTLLKSKDLQCVILGKEASNLLTVDDNHTDNIEIENPAFS